MFIQPTYPAQAARAAPKRSKASRVHTPLARAARLFLRLSKQEADDSGHEEDDESPMQPTPPIAARTRAAIAHQANTRQGRVRKVSLGRDGSSHPMRRPTGTAEEEWIDPDAKGACDSVPLPKSPSAVGQGSSQGHTHAQGSGPMFLEQVSGHSLGTPASQCMDDPRAWVRHSPSALDAGHVVPYHAPRGEATMADSPLQLQSRGGLFNERHERHSPILSPLRDGVVLYPADPASVIATGVELRQQEGGATTGVVSLLSPSAQGAYSTPSVDWDSSDVGLDERRAPLHLQQAAAAPQTSQDDEFFAEEEIDNGAGVCLSTQEVKAFLPGPFPDTHYG